MIAGLQEGQAHVWLLPVDEMKEGRLLEAGLPLLSAAERERFERFRHRGAQGLFLGGRLLMRCLLSFYGELTPAEWRIDVGENGKPVISNGPAGVRINISHTEGMVVLLAAAAKAVGVDIERPSRSIEPLDVGKPVFSGTEMEALRALTGETERLARFFRIWTIKESLVKAVGAGITDDLRRVTFEVSGETPKLMETTASLPAPDNAIFFSRHIVGGYLLAGTIFPERPISGILLFDAIDIIRRTIGV